MIMALNRDMRGVQLQALPQLATVDANTAPYELSDAITMAFARFPYPESFFSWTAGKSGDGVLDVFNRTDRPPPWYHGSVGTVGFPTTILRNPKELVGLTSALRTQAAMLTRFIVFETQISGETYQVIGRPRYDRSSETKLEGFVGFTVNINWVRDHYFSEITSQLTHVLASQSNIALSILDENGKTVTTNRPAGLSRSGLRLPVSDQHFPLLFFDPVLRTTGREEALPVRYWTARAEAIEDSSMLAAARGSRRTFMLISVAAVVTGIALILAIRAARAAAVLATMKSEFVSAVTHELKTPLSSIRLASETLVRGRYRSQEVIAEYAGILLSEVSRLTRTVENLLSITRVQDVGGFYMFEAVDLLTVVEEVLGRFQMQLKQKEFELCVDVPASLPPVRADRAAILQVLDNLLDNAIRYSNGTRHLSLSASTSGNQVSLRITDKGPGIPKDELPRVFDKFFRGRGVVSSGSGLGLAIAQRLLHDQGGEIRLHCAQASGTTAEVLLCLANEESRNETKNSDRRG